MIITSRWKYRSYPTGGFPVPLRGSPGLLVWVLFLRKKNSAICAAAIMDVPRCFH